MNRILLTILSIVSLISASSQDAKQFYERGLDLAQKGNADSAIFYFDKSIALNATEYVAWYNRGIAKTMLNRYEEALPDFEQTIKLAPAYKKAYLNRGTTRKHLTDYEGAMADFNYVISTDTANGVAYYNRGLLYNLLGKRINACLDFEKALKYGYKNAQVKMDRCVKQPTADSSIHSILYLTHMATSDRYGFTEAEPVKVGNGPEGGPNNARNYLELLRDINGKVIKYVHTGTCCPYESIHALMGKYAMLDKYEITYTDEAHAEKKAIVYITYYDYEEPLMLNGFRTVGLPKH